MEEAKKPEIKKVEVKPSPPPPRPVAPAAPQKGGIYNCMILGPPPPLPPSIIKPPPGPPFPNLKAPLPAPPAPASVEILAAQVEEVVETVSPEEAEKAKLLENADFAKLIKL